MFDHEAINTKKEPTTTASAPKLYKPQSFISASKPIQPEIKAENSAEKTEKDEVKHLFIVLNTMYVKIN